MKVLLVNPPLPESRFKNPVVKYLFSNAMPLGLAYLAAVLLEVQVKTRIIDAPAERLTQAETLDLIKKEKPDLLGLTSHTSSFAQAVELAKAVKKYAGASLPIVLGGVHSTAVPEQALAFDCFDYGVLGEGEQTLPELVFALARGEKDLSSIKGLALKKGAVGEVYFTPPRELIAELDLLPFPARQLLKTRLYSSIPSDVRYLPKFTISPTRGCPYNCIFCSSAASGRKFRSFSPSYIVSEMEMLKSDFKARELAFTTTTFTAERSKSEAFLDLLLAKDLKLAWTVSTRVDTLDKELLLKMKKAGCWCLRVGIESGSPEILNFIKKGITREQVQKAAQWCRELGIHLKGFFMIGHLPDNEETIRESIEFALSLPIGDITVQFNTPLPGTAQYQMAENYGELKKDYSLYHYWEPAFIPQALSGPKLISLQREFYRRFYWRPITLKRHFKKLLNFQTLINYLRSLDLFFYLCFKKADKS